MQVGLSHTSFKVARISSLLAQVDQVQLLMINYRVTPIFRKEKRSKRGFVTAGDNAYVFVFFAVSFRN